jgi:acyl-CoA thioester hydrolase
VGVGDRPGGRARGPQLLLTRFFMSSPEEPLEQLRSRFRIVIELPIAWADMDYFRHVNNTVFFRYFESARIAYLERIGFADEQAEPGVGPILHSTHCRFRLPLTYPDRVLVGARATGISDDRFTMEYAVFSQQLGRIAADGGGVVVSYDYAAATKTALPAVVRAAIVEMEGADLFAR